MSAEFYVAGILIVPIVDYTDSGAEVEVMGDNAFHVSHNDEIRTLSTKDASSGSTIKGVLFVPSLSESDDCFNTTSSYIPDNVLGKEDALDSHYPLIAIAPWVSADCTQSYLMQARETADVQAFVFYQPDNGTDTPPSAKSSVWDLGDGGDWKKLNNFPTYAINGAMGSTILDVLSTQTGNLTNLTAVQDTSPSLSASNFYAVASFEVVTNSSGPVLPSLWIFLVIVLATLLGVIMTTSVTMHLIMRRQRNALQRRIANGDVDLEALGIKRHNVPQDVLKKMPSYIYTPSSAPQQPQGPARGALAEHGVAGLTSETPATVSAQSSSPAGAPSTDTGSQWHQPTCAICLDDFEAQVTTVRELPCRHIFHPVCVDTFLLEHSSQCPVCKVSVLPPGYMPKTVTNAMVRRERIMRRSRARAVTVTNEPARENAGGVEQETTWRAGVRRAVASIPLTRRSEPAVMRPESVQLRPVGSEVVAAAADQGNTTTAVDPSTRRREMARQRAMSLAAHEQAPGDAQVEREPGSTRWRRFMTSVFPGFQ